MMPNESMQQKVMEIGNREKCRCGQGRTWPDTVTRLYVKKTGNPTHGIAVLGRYLKGGVDFNPNWSRLVPEGDGYKRIDICNACDGLVGRPARL